MSYKMNKIQETPWCLRNQRPTTVPAFCLCSYEQFARATTPILISLIQCHLRFHVTIASGTHRPRYTRPQNFISRWIKNSPKSIHISKTSYLLKIDSLHFYIDYSVQKQNSRNTWLVMYSNKSPQLEIEFEYFNSLLVTQNEGTADLNVYINL
jgi:hypothetical protein